MTEEAQPVDLGPEHPVFSDPARDERLLRGVVFDNRAPYVAAALQDQLDQMTVDLEKELIAEAGRGPVSAHFALVYCYRRLTIIDLRKRLTRYAKDATVLSTRRE